MGNTSGLSLAFDKFAGWVTGRKAPDFALLEQPPAINKSDLFGWASLDDNFKNLTYVMDPDVVLKRLRKTRADLELLLTDPDIKQAVNTRLDALVSTPFRLDPSDGDLPEFVWDNLTAHSSRILECTFLARLYGYSVAERVYAYDLQGRIVLKDIKPIDLRKCRITPADELELRINGAWVKVDTTTKYLLTRCSPTVTNPYGDALLSTLYWTWKFKTDALRFMMQYLERCGIPMIVGKTKRDVKAMAVAMKKAYQDAILSIDAEDSVELLATSAKGSSSDLGFIGVDNMFTKKILIMVLGQTLTTTTDGSGSRALGEVQDKVRMDKRDSDIRLSVPSVQNVVNAIVWLNWDASVVPPLVNYEDNKGLEATRAERDTKFLQTGEIRFTRGYYTNKYDFDDEDFVLKGEDGFATDDVDPDDTAKVEVNTPVDEGQEADAEKAVKNVEEANAGKEKKLALARTVYNFASEQGKFTRDEKAIEAAVLELAKATTEDFDTDAVVDAVLSAQSGEDMLNRLVVGLALTKEDDAPEVLHLLINAFLYGETAE